MTDALKLKNRLKKTISTLYPIEEIEATNPKAKFALRITPFPNAPNFMIIVEYLSELEMVRILPSIGIGKNLQTIYKKKTQPEKDEIIALFSKHMREHKFYALQSKDFVALQCMQVLLVQNMSLQTLLDSVGEGLFLLQDLGELLFQADQSLKVPKISETANNMFQ